MNESEKSAWKIGKTEIFVGIALLGLLASYTLGNLVLWRIQNPDIKVDVNNTAGKLSIFTENEESFSNVELCYLCPSWPSLDIMSGPKDGSVDHLYISPTKINWDW